MANLLPIRDERAYHPGSWAKASTLVAASGWFTQLWFAARSGADLSQGASLNAFGALFLAIIPLAVGTLCWSWWRHSQRAGDIAFSVGMIGQGIALAVVGAVAG